MVTLFNYHIVNDHEEGGGCISVYVSQMLHKTYIYYFGDLKWLHFSAYFVSPHFPANELLVISYRNLNIKKSRVDSAYCFPFSLKCLK